MRRVARIGGWIVAGLLAGLVLAVLAIQVLTRTSFGHERVRSFAVGWLNERVHGEVAIGRLEGGMLGGVKLHDFRISGEDGRTFVAADSAEVSYSLRTLLSGDIVLDHVVLFSPTVEIERLPGQEDWNFERIFEDTTAAPSDGTRTLIMFDNARIVDGTVVLRTPWTPDSPVEPSDTARVVLEAAPGGPVRVLRFAGVDATLDEVIWESPLEEGKLFRIESLSSSAYFWRDPLVIQDLRGTVTLRDTVLAFEAPVVELPGTRASALGRVLFGEAVAFDVRIDAPRVALADFRWLLPRLPDGGGTLVLRVQTQPVGTLYLVENATLTAPGTQMAGSFGIVAGDTLYFTRVDLRASPLDLDLIEELLPGTLPVEGLLIGTIEVEGPIAALRTSGDMRLSSPGAEPSSFAWSGTLDLRDRPSARSMHATLTRFDLAVLNQFRPGLQLPGQVDGTVDGSGSFDGTFQFTADLRHTSGGGELSELSATGTVGDARGDARLDVAVDARSLAFGPVAERYPSLAAFAGRVRGPVQLEGRLADLHIDADLETDAGPLQLDMRVGREGGRPRYGGEGRVSGFRLDHLRDDLPEAAASGRFAFDLSGSSLADLSGTASIDLDSLGVLGLGAYRVLGHASVADGLLRVDSLSARFAGGLLNAGGSLGLVEERAGALAVEFESDALEPLEPVLFGSIEDPAAPRVTGSGSMAALLEGSIHSMTLRSEARLDQLVVGPAAVSSGVLRLDGQDLGGDDARYTLAVAGDSLVLYSRRLDSITVDMDFGGGRADFRVAADARQRPALRADGSFVTEGDASVLRLARADLGDAGEAWTLDDGFELRMHQGRGVVSPFRMAHAAGDGELVGGGSFAWAAPDSGTALPMDLRIDLTGMPMADVVRFTRSEESTAGTLHGSLRMAGTPDAPLLDTEFGIDRLRWGASAMDSVRARFDYADRLLAGRMGLYDAGRPVLHGQGGIPLDLRFVRTDQRRIDLPLAFDVQADSLPVALLTAVVDGFTDVQGVLDGRLTASGTSAEPQLDGAFVVRRGAATWDATGVRYRDLAGTLVLRDESSVELDLNARGGAPEDGGRGGGARIQGILDLATPSDPGFDLRLRADRLLAARRRDVEVTASGEVTLAGRYSRPMVSGELTVDGGTLYIDELYRQVLIVGLEDPLLFDVVDTSLVTVKRVLPESQSPFLRNLAVQDLRVRVGQGAWIRSRDMNVEVTGELTLDFDRRSEDLRMTGNLAAVRGTYQLYYPPFARRFEVRDGTVEFPGTPGIDPNLRISAAYRARTPNEPLEIIANVSGTLRNPRVRLSSAAEPPISESDLASYLFFGVPTYALDSSGAADENGGDGFAGLGVSAFAPTALGYVASGLQTLAQNFGLVDYVGLTAAESAPGTPGDAGIGGLLAATEIELGRYLSPTMFVAYTQRLAAQNYSAGARLEWRFHPTFTAELFAEDRFARAPSFGYTEAAALRKVYGFSLFREWGY